MRAADRGSTIPLIVGFFLVALLASAGAVVAGQAFVAQRDLQDQCDGVAAAVAARAADVDRSAAIGAEALRFADVQRLVEASVAREQGGWQLHVAARLTDQDRTIRLRCSATVPVAFGVLFGRPNGLRHVVDSSAQEPISS